MSQLEKDIEELIPQVIEWRRTIHQYPELGFKEFKTNELIKKILEETDLKLIHYPDSTAVIAVLEGGKPGPAVGFRADMDALAVTEEVDVPFKSQHPGVMHACGHDFHVALLMGTARLLDKYRSEIKGRILFIFQPAEEAPPGGAREIVDRGILEEYELKKMLALHVASDLPVGEISLTPGFSSANTDGAVIKIKGKSCHGATPHKGVDAVLVGAHIVIALQSLVSRMVDPLDSAVVSIGTVEAGEVVNSIAEKATLKATIRSLTQETRELLEKKIPEICIGVAKTFGAECSVEYQRGYPAVYNEPTVVEEIKKTAEKLLGPEKVHEVPQSNMGGDDYAYFVQNVPGAIFLLGGAFPVPVNYSHHSSLFQINEECIGYGLRLMAALLKSE